MNNEIIIDDGLEEVKVKNKFGEEIGKFYFRPTDIGILTRYREAVDTFDEITKPLEEANIGTSGEGETDKDEKAIAEAQHILFDKFNYIFGGNFAEAFFGSINPFSPVGGKFYCEQAIEMVGKYISNRFEKEAKASQKRVSKYTDNFSSK